MNPTKTPQLRMLFWESTSRCNLSCVHCRRLETEDSDNELSTDEVKKVFDSVSDLGKPVVVFSGGEPLLRDDWEELAQYAGSLSLPTALATNGTLINDKTASQVVKAGFRRVAVSLDGPDPQTHDEFRGLSGAFEKAIAGIKALNRVGMPIQINSTIAAHNADRIDDLYELAEFLNAVAIHLFLLVPVGCGLEIAKTHQLSAKRYERVLGWVCDKQLASEKSLELRVTCAPHYYRIAAQRGATLTSERGCLCGLSVVFVSHTGEVFPCGYLPKSCGSVRNKYLAQIWNNSAVFNNLRNLDLEGKCESCDFKAICGGCRARAFAATGNYLASEPFCSYNCEK